MSRFARQTDLVPPEKLAKEHILIIGAGAVGRNLGQTLAALGSKRVDVIDLDTVEDVNICTQGYTKHDIGKSKSETLVKLMKDLDYEGDAKFTADTEAWRPKKYRDMDPTIVFSCVDTMVCRKSIYKYCLDKTSVNLFVDVRMLGLVLKLYTYTRADLHEYEKTLFTDEEAEQGRCTQRSTMYAADILANLAAGQLALYLRGFKGKQIYTQDLLDTLIA